MITKLKRYFKNFRDAHLISMNERNLNYIMRYNDRSLYSLVDDKTNIKKSAPLFDINCPKLIAIIEYQHEVSNFLDYIENYNTFVIKPSCGSGGRGILVIKNREGNTFFKTDGEKIELYEIKRHIANTISGLYSLGGKIDKALIEECVEFSDIFAKYSYQGVPDVRIITFKGFPVMAMLRAATAESKGRANLHQGAIGIGIDIKTGKALQAVQKNRVISVHPDTKAQLRDIKIPMWREHLKIATTAFDCTKLGYLGVDIVLDKNHGPMLLEVNARPGLAIQIANNYGLRKRLQQIESLTDTTVLNVDQRINFILENF
ncbi:alpha-L-glutamate ligase-like protein [Lentisphaerota bacterium WC36G]|nr:alpha-L-glutamate ligase-like protein [Lentisphaerae bacterium WC36]